MDGMHVLSFVVVATRAFVRIVLKHRVRDARVRKRRREEYARRGLHHSLPEHRLFRSIERQTSSTRVAKTQISRNVCPFPVSRDDDFFTFCVASFREEKKNTRRVHRARHRAIAQNRRKNAPNGSLRSSMHVAEPSLPFLRAFARLRASLRVTFSSTFSSLKPLFFCSVYFFSFLSFFCLTFVFRVHSNDTISSASFVQEAKENLKKKPRSTVRATRKCAIRTIMSLEVRRVRRIYFAFRARENARSSS